jgi:hypothetical protein
MFAFILVHLLIACKPNSEPQQSYSTQNPDQTDTSLYSSFFETNGYRDEFGFDILLIENDVYASAPNSTQGKVFKINSSELELVHEGFGRVGHQLISINSELFIHTPQRGLVHNLNSINLFEGYLGSLASDDQHWYSLQHNTLLIDGIPTESFEETAYDLAVCDGHIGITFPYSNNKLWIDWEWYIASTPLTGQYLHCFDYDNDGQPEWFLGGENQVFIIDGTNIQTINAPFHTFGKSIEFSPQNNGLIDLFISAPDGGNAFQGWVGQYRSSGKDLGLVTEDLFPDKISHDVEFNLIQEWYGLHPNDRFGYSTLYTDPYLYVGAPFSDQAYVQRIEVNSEQ